jgi:ribose transport system ATP-binding protein
VGSFARRDFDARRILGAAFGENAASPMASDDAPLDEEVSR